MTNFIRASMLPAYTDCARRAAARQFRRLIEGKGFALRSIPPAVAAPMGTAMHKAIALMLRDRDFGPSPVSAALAAFRTEIAPGCEWDDTSPKLDVAERQITRMVESLHPILRAMRPRLIEHPMRAVLARGWEASGSLDVEQDATLTDWKSGAMLRPYHAQLGMYALLLRANGEPCEAVRQVYVPRVRLKKPQPAPLVQEYDVADCERAAETTVEAVIRDTERFQATGDPYSYPANPMSMLCTQKYCPVWGTEFCTLHLPEKPKPEAPHDAT